LGSIPEKMTVLNYKINVRVRKRTGRTVTVYQQNTVGRQTVIHSVRKLVQGCIQKFPDWVDKEIYAHNNKHSLRRNTKVVVAKLIRLTHKIAIQPHLVAECCTIFSSRSRRPVRKLLDTFSYDVRHYVGLIVSVLLLISVSVVPSIHLSILFSNTSLRVKRMNNSDLRRIRSPDPLFTSPKR